MRSALEGQRTVERPAELPKSENHLLPFGRKAAASVAEKLSWKWFLIRKFSFYNRDFIKERLKNKFDVNDLGRRPLP